MRIRALVFEDDPVIRAHVCQILHRRGYEVFAFSEPGLCPLQQAPACQCAGGQYCGDIVISDIQMPRMTGLKFLQDQRQKGCQVKHVALMSGAWSEADLAYARQMGCHTFRKPFSSEEINRWLTACERQIDPNRLLSDWFVGQLARAEPEPPGG